MSQISKYDFDLIEKNEKDLVEVCGNDLYVEDLINQARDIGIENNDTASTVQATVMLAEEIYARNVVEGKRLLSEALKMAKKENRLREINIIKETTESYMIDFDSL